MCVVSNVGDHYGQHPDQWPWQPIEPYRPLPSTTPDDFKRIWEKHLENVEITDLKKRVEALEELLRKAEKFDADTGQPECGLEEKKELLRKLARELGVEINL